MRGRIDHTAAGQPPLELRNPRGQIVAHHVSEVASALADVDTAARSGLYAAGFVCYEAAPAFDSALTTHPPTPRRRRDPDLPLAWFGLFSDASPVTDPGGPFDRGGPGRRPATEWACDDDEDQHAESIVHIQKQIAAGDVYLVNLTSRFRRPWSDGEDPFELYRQLVSGYSAGYHAYFETDEWTVACASPELFFEWSGNEIVTHPMKGTAPRGRWSGDDLALAEALRTSGKERAENTMVVDMLRNDVGRIAVPGSVTAPSLWRVEQHPIAWQMSSTVRAHLPRGLGLPDVFTALFPCASVTGAPKVSAMSVIADLEDSPRGVYCGAVGLVRPASADTGGHPAARFAVAIRTAVVDRRRGAATYGSGGGITADSTPSAEWDEVLLKARALTDPRPLTLGLGQGLIETMAFESGGSDADRIRHLGAHLERLRGSARYFGWTVPTDLGERLHQATRGLGAPARVRVVLRAEGDLEIETERLSTGTERSPLRLCVDLDPIDAGDALLFHKTTMRTRYDERTRRHPSADDVVLVNQHGEVTETTRANLAVRLGRQWCTPPLRCGLLPGVQRARDVAAGVLAERVITVEDLFRAEAVATLSSLRGWRSASVRMQCHCDT